MKKNPIGSTVNLIIICCISLSTACGGFFSAQNNGQLQDDSQIGGTTLEPTFRNVSAVIQQRCLSCHSGPSPAAGRNWDNYASVLDAVRPFNPNDSLLFNKVNSNAMPLGGPPLTNAQKNLIKNWIAAGALNN